MLYVKNGRVLTMAGKIFENGQVVIENGKIKAVGEKLSCPDPEEVIDAQGGWILPGWWKPIAISGLPKKKRGLKGTTAMR